ncbi:dTMP kinase [Arcanobacterium buesumense]|uniref:Thymidylate kinase n=1 Tax=Arcanobacterium buesumense TaxID=2722751 RepID=A0A6H2EN71_9ACTO|nr:dTMP kinase [Arcanobacterium buesumense]QJC22523.1 dTMP kinase [Arcanobacterium buesumense]
MTGLFISFEGGDGAGKSTQVQLLASWLTESGYTVVVTREPGGTELGAQIRHLLLHGGDVSARAEALLYAADRAQNMDTKIAPALNRGEIVITDRYLDSSVAYQGAARALGKDEVRDLSLWAVQGRMPDMTFLLDVPVETGKARVGTEQDRLEAAGVEFHQQVRREFLALAEDRPDRWHVIDGTQSIDAIAQRIQESVSQALKNGELVNERHTTLSDHSSNM